MISKSKIFWIVAVCHPDFVAPQQSHMQVPAARPVNLTFLQPVLLISNIKEFGANKVKSEAKEPAFK